MLLVQSIQITDKFGFDEQQSRKSNIGGYSDNNETEFTTTNPGRGFCVNAFGKLCFHISVFKRWKDGNIDLWCTYLM